MNDDDPRHGTPAGHLRHRLDGEDACPACVAAKTKYEKVRNLYGPRMVPAIGTRRRIQALKAMGHSGADIAVELGVTYQAVHKLEHGKSAKVFANTAQSVRAVYDRMSMTLPTGYHRTRIRNQSTSRGYAPPLCWDDIDDPNASPQGVWTRHFPTTDEPIDPVVVTRIFDGDYHLPCSPADKAAVASAWSAAGRSLNELGRLTGWNVARYYKKGKAA